MSAKSPSFLVLASLLFTALISQSWAQSAPAIATPTSDAEENIWKRDHLTGNWGGVRTTLEDAGISFDFNYTADALGTVSGGIRRRGSYVGFFEMSTDIDLEKLVGWSGGNLHATGHQIHGRGLSPLTLGNLNPASSNEIEAHSASRLFTLWFEQKLLEDKVSLKVGQLAADDDFFISDTASLFVNGTFGWPAIGAVNLPSGGPAYPFSAPAFQAGITPAENLTFLAAVFSGDPAGRFSERSPEERNPDGTTFSFRGGAFAIAEAQYSINKGEGAVGLPGTYKIGGWHHSGRFDDQRYDRSGLLLASPDSIGEPRRHRSNFTIYGIADQMVWREDGTEDQGLNLFLRLGGGPSDRNLVNFYFDIGAGYKGLIPTRDRDILGIAFAYAPIAKRARRFDRDTRAFSRQEAQASLEEAAAAEEGEEVEVTSAVRSPVRNYEAVLELTYAAEITPWWIIQPDLQFIFHPGANVADPRDPEGERAIRDAIVIGIRSSINF